jgi:hypothetical protein
MIAMNVHPHQPCETARHPGAPELDLVSRIRGEFHEMPGMRLSLDQAMRLWSLDRDTCRCVLERLMAARFLELDGNGQYKRAHAGY